MRLLKPLAGILVGAILAAPIMAWALGGETDPMYVYNQAVASAAVTPSDTTVLTLTRALYNGNATACNIALKLKNDSAAVTFNNVQSGAILPVAAKVVMSTNTTCSTIVALY